MTSRQRMLTAMSCRQPDRVPLHFRLFGFVPPEHFAWSNDFERVDRWASIGVDDTLTLGISAGTHPDVRTRSWREEPTADEPYPLICTEYDTPAGVLRHIVREAGNEFCSDRPWKPKEVHLFDDYNVPRAKEHAVTGPEDLPKLRYLLTEPSDEQIEQFRRNARRIKNYADQHGVLVTGWGSSGVDAAVWLCGVQGAVLAAVDQPEFFGELLDILHACDVRACELLLDAGVDVLVRRGWYEGTHFWSPELYRRFFAPRVRQLADMAHQAGAKFACTMSAGIMPLLETFKDVGLDVLYHVDPVQGEADLPTVKETLGEQVAVLGGINSAVTLGRGSRDEIRQAVFDAVETMAPGGGFILSPVDCLFPDTPWEAVETVVEAWREVCDYDVG
ncbi:MAG: uroporphyrinogen decarboxylase family protein [Planctomycetota bacterium]|jgi:uroporphyrinogen decarboxylase